MPYILHAHTHGNYVILIPVVYILSISNNSFHEVTRIKEKILNLLHIMLNVDFLIEFLHSSRLIKAPQQ